MAACLFAAPGAALAHPTFFFDGSGFNRLNVSALSTAASAVGLSIAPGDRTTADGTLYLFPIAGGAVDQKTLVLETVSTGVFKISGNGNTVTFSAPIVNTIAATPEMTFLVTINGNLQGRFEVFTLTVPTYPAHTLRFGEKVHAAGITVALSQVGTNILNTSFGTSFAAGQAVGTLTVMGVLGQKLPG